MTDYTYVDWYQHLYDQHKDDAAYIAAATDTSDLTPFLEHQFAEYIRAFDARALDDRWENLRRCAVRANTAFENGDPNEMAMAFAALGEAIERLRHPSSAESIKLKQHRAHQFIQGKMFSLYGAKGGRASKRSGWAEEVARKLAAMRQPTDQAAWEALPDSTSAWQIETDHADYEVYVDGGKIVGVNSETEKEKPLTKGTFLKVYYRPAKKAGN